MNTITFNLPPGLRDFAIKRANKKGQTVAAYMRTLLLNELADINQICNSCGSTDIADDICSECYSTNITENPRESHRYITSR